VSQREAVRFYPLRRTGPPYRRRVDRPTSGRRAFPRAAI